MVILLTLVAVIALIYDYASKIDWKFKSLINWINRGNLFEELDNTKE